jgi:prophage regulatory protein
MPDTPDRILRLGAVLDRTGLSRSTVYRKIQAGTFPKNVQISTRCAGWRESAVEAWMRNPMSYQAADHPTE